MAMAIKNEWVSIEGNIITNPSYQVDMSIVRAGGVKIDDEPLDPLSPLIIMLHKPVGYTCSLKDPGDIIYDLLPERFRGRKPVLSSVGRLDKYSSGQLLLTDDGDLLHRLIHPKKQVKKYYHVQLEGDLRGNEAELFARGDFLLKGDEKPLKPAEWISEDERTGVMILSEGRYHQIRRMFEMLGNKVVALHRYKTGSLEMKNLGEGEWRIISEEERQKLFA